MNAAYQMMQDCVNGNLTGVSAALKSGGDPNRGYAGTLPLGIAVEQGDADLAAVVLAYGADPDKRPGLNSRTPREQADRMAKGKNAKLKDAAKLILGMMVEDEKKAEEARKAQEPSIEGRLSEEKTKDLRKTLMLGVFVSFLAVAVFIHHLLFGSHGQRALQNATGDL